MNPFFLENFNLAHLKTPLAESTSDLVGIVKIYYALFLSY